MRGLHLFSGQAHLKLESADIPAILRNLTEHNITLTDIRNQDDLTATFRIRQQDLQITARICQNRGGELTLIGQSGLSEKVNAFVHRPVLVIGILLLIAVGMLLPTRVLFISVEGNSMVPENQILECASQCGLGFFCSRRSVRSEQIKNQLLEMLPQLKWAGVNTYGCHAVISVREQERHQTDKVSGSVGHIVALRDGIVSACTATDGSVLCKTGQAVHTGDVLISGYTDCGRTIICTRASGSVFAKTVQLLTAIFPTDRLIRTSNGDTVSRYSLILGKKRINFYKGSGISGGTCVKMYTKYVLTLPGGFQLPVSLVQERITSTLTQAHRTEPADAVLQNAAVQYLQGHMTEGRLLQKEEQLRQTDGSTILTGKYLCEENIGIFQEEKIGESYE